MEIKRCRMMLGVLFFSFLYFITPISWGEEPRLFRIGTGGRTGVYYPIGKLIAQGITPAQTGQLKGLGNEAGIQGIIGVAQNSAGSIENVRAVIAGDVEAGLVQADIAAFAFGQKRMFQNEKAMTEIRAIASLYPEKFQIVVRRDADVVVFQDLKDKRISIDEVGSGTLSVMQIVLEAHTMKEADLKPVYLKPVFTQDKMISGELQGFVMMSGAPMKALMQLLSVGINIVPIAPEIASGIHKKFPYLVPGIIPDNIYPGIPETPTLQVNALLVVSSSMPDDLVYQVTRSLWSQKTLDLLHGGHPQGKSITLESALEGISIPVHQGARRFYLEQGIALENN